MRTMAIIGRSAMFLGVLCTAIFIAQNLIAQEENSAAVTGKAWEAFTKQDWDGAIAQADRAINIWFKQAKEMNDKLTEYPPKETAATFWAVNDIGTCYFIKGEALVKKGDKKGAIEAYAKLCKELKYSQCWDAKGWFWKPAEAAKQKLVELQFETQ